MKISSVFVIAAVAGMMALTSSRAGAGTIVADWTLSNDATGYSGGSTTSGVPLDSVGGHNFQNGFGNNTPGSGGSVGGPSSTSSQWNGGGGWYATQAGTTTYPTDNFSVEVHASVGSLSQGILFSSDGNTSGDLQIGEDGSGNWVAFVSSNGQNYPSGSYSGIEVGSCADRSCADYDLKVTDLNGVFSFSVNGVSTGPGVTPSTFGGFSAPHIAVAPGGGGPNYSGFASDLTITSGVTAVPEPASFVLFGLGLSAVGLTLALRRRTDANSGS